MYLRKHDTEDVGCRHKAMVELVSIGSLDWYGYTDHFDYNVPLQKRAAGKVN